MSCVFFLRSTQTFVGPLLILNTFVEIMCCSSFHTSHAVMRTTCSSAHKSFLPFNRSVCLGVLWIRNMCGSDLKSVCVCTRAQRSLVCAADSPVEWLKVRHQRPNSSAGFMFIPPPLCALLPNLTSFLPICQNTAAAPLRSPSCCDYPLSVQVGAAERGSLEAAVIYWLFGHSGHPSPSLSDVHEGK